MKIIQSFWSKPLNIKNNKFELQDFRGTWLHEKYFIFSWALSTLLLKKNYGYVNLFTDTLGERFFNEVLDLPFTEINTDLESLDRSNQNIWSLGKIFTYSIQSEPFIHFDGDVFIWDKVPYKDTNDIVCQNLESNLSVYTNCHQIVESESFYLPSFMDRNFNSLAALNAGVMGGINLHVFKELFEEVETFLDRNSLKLKKHDQNLFAPYLEQLFLNYLCVKNDLKVQRLFKTEDNLLTKADFYNLPEHSKYIHTVAFLKQNPIICHSIESVLCLEFPDYYLDLVKRLDFPPINNENHQYRMLKLYYEGDVSYFLGLKLKLANNIEIYQKDNIHRIIYQRLENTKFYEIPLKGNMKYILSFHHATHISEVLNNIQQSSGSDKLSSTRFLGFIRRILLETEILEVIEG